MTARSGNGNVARLAIAQALAGANSTVVYATGAIIGHGLAPDPALSTLPISIFVVGMAACIAPTGLSFSVAPDHRWLTLQPASDPYTIWKGIPAEC